MIYELTAHGYLITTVSMDSFQCLAKGTRVSTDRGLIPIEEVKVGDTVQSRIGPRAVEKTWSFGEQPTLKIHTEGEEVLEGTGKHRVEVQVGWSPTHTNEYGRTRNPIWEWRKLSDLRVGDVVNLISAPVAVDSADVELIGSKTEFGWRPGDRGVLHDWELPWRMTPALAEWLGISWGDGSIVEDGVRVAVAEDEAPDAQKVFHRLFGISPPYYPKEEGACHGTVSISSRWITRWMSANGLVKPLVPEPILRSSRICKASFLRGLFATDGSVSKQGSVTLSTKHKTLANTVRLILRVDFGIESGLVTIERGYPGDYVQTGFQYVVVVRGARKKFLDSIGFSYSRKQQLLEKHRGIKGRRKFARVALIEKSQAEVFDLQVADDPSYVAAGFVNHNSVDGLQQLSQKGYNALDISVDTTPDPYDNLKTALYEDRLFYYEYPPLLEELRKLEQKWNAQKKRKIDHPPRGGKDAADALAGCLWTLSQNSPSSQPLAPLKGFSRISSDDSWLEEQRQAELAGNPFAGRNTALDDYGMLPPFLPSEPDKDPWGGNGSGGWPL